MDGTMTSLATVKTQIAKFLASETPEVLSVKGAWGTGKTYVWKKYLAEVRDSQKIACKYYCYLSLFGINSVEELKIALLTQTHHKCLIKPPEDILKKHWFSRNFLRKMWSKIVKLINGLLHFIPSIFSTLRLGDAASRAIAFLSIEKTIICIDDLERKGEKLRVQDILGFISDLKEQKKCKVVFLLNEDALKNKKDDYADFRTYYEKVIDKELLFEPTAKECLDIVFKPDENPTVIERCQKLEITNIRILIKIQKFWEEIKPVVADYDKDTQYSIISSLVLFSYLHLTKNEDYPSINDIAPKKGDDNTLCLSPEWDWLGNNEPETPETKKGKRWRDRLRNYGYTDTDALDLQIARFVENGYFDEESLKQALAEQDKLVINDRKNKALDEAWAVYKNSFDDNEKEVVEGIYNAAMECISSISRSELNKQVMLLRDLGYDDDANNLVNVYVQLHDEIGYFNLPEGKWDTYLKEKFKQKYEQLRPKETARDVLHRIAEQNSWSQEDMVILAATTAEEYYTLFKAEKGEHLSSYIRTCLGFGNIQNSTEQQEKIARNTKEALRMIGRGKENNINKARVEWLYGVCVEAEDVAEAEAVG
jgi:hypothetical protein